MKQTAERAVAAEILRPVFDENGEQIGMQAFKPVYDENGQQVGEEKVDHEADEKQKEEEAKQSVENGDAEEDVDIEFGEVVGETEEDKAAEEERARKLKEENDAKAASIMASDLPDDQKRAALLELYTTTVEEYTW